MMAAFTSKATDFEDAIQYFTALHHGLDYYLTLENDFGKGFINILPVLSPSDFLKQNDI